MVWHFIQKEKGFKEDLIAHISRWVYKDVKLNFRPLSLMLHCLLFAKGLRVFVYLINNELIWLRYLLLLLSPV